MDSTTQCRFYDARDIQEICGIGRTKAYAIIKDLNAELSKKGYITLDGKIPKKYFESKIFGEAS